MDIILEAKLSYRVFTKSSQSRIIVKYLFACMTICFILSSLKLSKAAIAIHTKQKRAGNGITRHYAL